MIEALKVEGLSWIEHRIGAPGRTATPSTFGIDPIVALLDNSDVKRNEIPDLLGWTAARLVAAALDEANHADPSG